MPLRANSLCGVEAGVVALALLVLTPALQASTGRSFWPSPAKMTATTCNPRSQTCCFNPDGKAVPPGTRRGPYTCLPNGTWG